jgi:enoyl-[acyl-carrier protein] reductase I
VTGEIHYVDSGYNIISMPRPEDLKNGVVEAKTT